MMSYHLPEKPTNVDRLPRKDSASFQNDKRQTSSSPTIFVQGTFVSFPGLHCCAKSFFLKFCVADWWGNAGIPRLFPQVDTIKV